MALSIQLQSSSVSGRSRDLASPQSGNIIVFSTCMTRLFRYNMNYSQIVPYRVTQLHLPYCRSFLLHTHTCMKFHIHFSAHDFAFLFTVIENAWLVKILVFSFLTPSSLLKGEEKKSAKWLEQILKTLLKMQISQNICSLDVLQLALLWNFPGIKINGDFSATYFSYFHVISLFSLHASVEVVLLLH